MYFFCKKDVAWAEHKTNFAADTGGVTAVNLETSCYIMMQFRASLIFICFVPQQYRIPVNSHFQLMTTCLFIPIHNRYTLNCWHSLIVTLSVTGVYFLTVDKKGYRTFLADLRTIRRSSHVTKKAILIGLQVLSLA